MRRSCQLGEQKLTRIHGLFPHVQSSALCRTEQSHRPNTWMGNRWRTKIVPPQWLTAGARAFDHGRAVRVISCLS
jgi:hypothetical protein